MNNVKKSFRTVLLMGAACLAAPTALADSIEDPGALAVPEYILAGEMPPAKAKEAPEEGEQSAVPPAPEEEGEAEAVAVSDTPAMANVEDPEQGDEEPAKLDTTASASLEDEIRDYELSRGTGQKPDEDPAKPCSDATKICTLKVNVGELQMLQLSSLHMNRLITPFTDPEIITTDQEKFTHDVRGNSIYFQPVDDSRSLLYIRETGPEDPVMQLAIAGQGVVPRQIALEFSDGTHFPPNGSKNRRDNGEMDMAASSIMQQVRAEFTTVAQMGIPDGFTLVSRNAALPEFCVNHNGAQFTFAGGQKLSGADYDIFVGIVSNQTASDIRLDETWCSSESVMAVAFWEDVLLSPGHESEVYVAARQLSQPTYNERKSLIRGVH